MTKQILKKKVDFFTEYLLSVGTLENNYIMINETIYNKAKYNNLIQPFLLKLEPYYHKSKQFYIQRDITYNGFITILRQIAKHNEAEYESKLKYTKSTHYIEYYFKL